MIQLAGERAERVDARAVHQCGSFKRTVLCSVATQVDRALRRSTKTEPRLGTLLLLPVLVLVLLVLLGLVLVAVLVAVLLLAAWPRPV